MVTLIETPANAYATSTDEGSLAVDLTDSPVRSLNQALHDAVDG